MTPRYTLVVLYFNCYDMTSNVTLLEPSSTLVSKTTVRKEFCLLGVLTTSVISDLSTAARSIEDCTSTFTECDRWMSEFARRASEFSRALLLSDLLRVRPVVRSKSWVIDVERGTGVCSIRSRASVRRLWFWNEVVLTLYTLSHSQYIVGCNTFQDLKGITGTFERY